MMAARRRKLLDYLKKNELSATRQLSRNSACVAKLVPPFPFLVFDLSNSKPCVASLFPTFMETHGTFVPE